MDKKIFISAILILLSVTVSSAQAEPVKINLAKIAFIESSGNPLAWNKKDDSRGLFQITPICLKEYNQFHSKGRQYSMDDLWNPQISTVIAEWYLNKRIPQLLKHFGIEDSVKNRIIAYNAGINTLTKKKPLPKITLAYLRKYGAK